MIAYQIRQSFKPGEVTAEEANRLGYEPAMRFTKGKYAFIVATHTDRAHIHNHVIFNSTALDGTGKFQDFHLSGLALQRLSDVLCLENGLSIITPKPYGERQKRTVFPHRPKLRDRLREDIDRILNKEKKPKDFKEFLQMLEVARYEIKTGKNISVKGKDQKWFIRLNSLPEGYREDELRAALEGKAPMPARKTNRPEKKVDFILDIRSVLQSKGPGYARWATKYNLKQMSASLLLLRTHGLKSFEELNELVSARIKLRDEKLSAVQASEKRLTEISVLKTHIINYSKTRATYEEYRKSSYSRKFPEAHREEITLHKAAKKAFDELGVKKIPKVKGLSAEYARVLALKKKQYAEFRQVRDEMQELLIAQKNIESLYAACDEQAAETKRQTQQEH